MKEIVKRALRKIAEAVATAQPQQDFSPSWERVTNPNTSYAIADSIVPKNNPHLNEDDRATVINAYSDLIDSGMRGASLANNDAYADALAHNQQIISDYLKNNDAPQFKELLSRIDNVGSKDPDWTARGILHAVADPAALRFGYNGTFKKRLP